MILLSLKPPEVRRGYRQGAVIQEPGHVLDALTGVPAELGGGMAQDVKAGRWHVSPQNVTAEANRLCPPRWPMPWELTAFSASVYPSVTSGVEVGVD